MKQLLSLLALLLSAHGYGQMDPSLALRWKLQTNEVVHYKTTMQEVDTSGVANFSINLGGIFELLNKDSIHAGLSRANAFFQDLNKAVDDMPLITRLSRKKEHVVDIEMLLDDKPSAKKSKDSSVSAMVDLMGKMTGAVMLRGAVYDSGAIESFYVKNDQRNLIAVFFQLPGKPVKVGDSWSLDVNFISMDQNFKCDTAYRKNKVTLLDVKESGAGKIAVLKYDLEEFISGDFNSPMFGTAKGSKTMMKVTYQAVGEFSVEKGRWSSYNGFISIAASGVVTQASTKKFSLSPQ
ncbi:hypothetical protein [Flaviaesturariibacter aridisoli]|uniref:Uncharacterized protein n=1 Tax=Flaviaesturariibacter aridisoli TaxID=2545761 RepID=A0A4R4E454_9BACT|nr:hypothetical protein [Flaviaesturariibacter aridisoli]TCZ73470.1 hypothetical protein E0486_05790 [Flaviaesturariibacter aridisoli]